ncbi:calcium uniporter protein 3, mitochondrial-like [Solanum lycopersicum]|uniref:Calcium uniporter protein C-terminal domain-containing protein n=1 Tax=Solanum lycopersicum TaxID=4081 RepID=A0A3Q7FJN3_SOLLC|nr:calcium uniporter protein 3, mitochondrial-like [Solanum lycopersicum]
MAFKKTLQQRIFSGYKFCAPSLTLTCRITSSTISEAKSTDKNIDPCRFLYQSSVYSPEIRQRLHGMDISSRDKMRFINEVLLLPRPPLQSESLDVGSMTGVQLELLKTRLRKMEKNWILFAEFIKICKETCNLDDDKSLKFAKKMDESGDVIVMGNFVFLRPYQVVEAMQEVMRMHKPNHEKERMKELERMEEEKTSIDKKVVSLVRKEMWFGLGCFIIQTIAFMRFTFWDLTWDVMEPICFYLTSTYFITTCIFFLKTSKEPSFQGFFQARFSTKQNRLMKVRNFDLQRYNELQRAHYPPKK